MYDAAALPTVSKTTATRGARLYYLHPLLAGPVSGWASHFARCHRLGFSHVLIAPPFVPGRSGDVFVTADHDRLHPALGGGEAEAGLRQAARLAREHGLGLMLDIVPDRVAVDAPVAQAFPGLFAAPPDGLPPDPRMPPDMRFAAAARFDAGGGDLLGWWQARVAAWLGSGVAGFRCVAAHGVPADFWRALISAAKAADPRALFVAWLDGATHDQATALAGCGFDLASSSSWAWDFRSDWLDDDTQAVSAVGAVLAAPEPPFGRRLAMSAPEIACRRAASFAGAFGDAWLMPMGFEFGARTLLDPAHGSPAIFDRLAEHPRFDLSSAIGAINEGDGAVAAGPAMLVSAPGSAVGVLRRPAADRPLILVNARVDQASVVPEEILRGRLDGATLPPGECGRLDPGEVRGVALREPPPVAMPPVDPGAGHAVQAARIAIEAVTPSVDGGRFAAKRIVGSRVGVAADIVCDGHETLAAVLRWRPADATAWHETAMRNAGNDRWTGEFPLQRLGRHEFTIEAWLDEFGKFQTELAKKHAAGVAVHLELREGQDLVARAAGVPELKELEKRLRNASADQQLALLLAPATAELMAQADTHPFAVQLPAPVPVDAERVAAGFASWYELFPRSQSPAPGQHGTFADVIARLPAIRDMGFDVLYFPPIHPIGHTNRKGRNNALRAAPDDPGSPYAIGAEAGGHDAVHEQLGTLEDFRHLCDAARGHGMEIALDFAIQCSPDHPWLRQHPEWFTWRPDGSVRFAENPPKRYEDIVNVAFYAEGAPPGLWIALRDIVLFWAEQGVRLFRVDNPHTKPLPFWEWMIGDVRARHPDVIFLAEAFTRPKVMYRLAKVGFSQSYTYFTWRNTARELREYLTELTTTAPRDFFRPHFFVNTPDINPEFLHHAGRPGFLLRAALAATLSGLWGVYNGFELCEARSLNGREEYLDSEKYELRHWDHNRPGNIVAEIRRLNHIRRSNPALHSHLGVTFLPCSNDAVLCFAKATADFDNVVVAAISFDPATPQDAAFDIPADLLGPKPGQAFLAENLMHGGGEPWHPGWRSVRLDPADLPFALWRLQLAEG